MHIIHDLFIAAVNDFLDLVMMFACCFVGNGLELDESAIHSLDRFNHFACRIIDQFKTELILIGSETIQLLRTEELYGSRARFILVREIGFRCR